MLSSWSNSMTGDAVELAFGSALGAPRGLDVALAVVDRDSLQEVVAEVEVVVGCPVRARTAISSGPVRCRSRRSVRRTPGRSFAIWMPTMSSAVVLLLLATKTRPSERMSEVGREVEAASALVGDEADCGDGLELEFRLSGHGVFTLTPALSLRERGSTFTIVLAPLPVPVSPSRERGRFDSSSC